MIMTLLPSSGLFKPKLWACCTLYTVTPQRKGFALLFPQKRVVRGEVKQQYHQGQCFKKAADTWARKMSTQERTNLTRKKVPMTPKKAFLEELWPKVGLNSSAIRGLGMSVTTFKSTCCHYSANSSAIHFTEARLRHVPDRPAKHNEQPGCSKPQATVQCAGSLYSHQLSRAYMLCLFPDLLMLVVHPVSMQFNSVTDEMWVRKKKESFIWILHQCFKKIYGGE